MCAVLQEQGNAQVGLFSFIHKFVFDYVNHVWLKSTSLCRTVSGVKMKKEYREFIEANK